MRRIACPSVQMLYTSNWTWPWIISVKNSQKSTTSFQAFIGCRWPRAVIGSLKSKSRFGSSSKHQAGGWAHELQAASLTGRLGHYRMSL